MYDDWPYWAAAPSMLTLSWEDLSREKYIGNYDYTWFSLLVFPSFPAFARIYQSGFGKSVVPAGGEEEVTTVIVDGVVPSCLASLVPTLGCGVWYRGVRLRVLAALCGRRFIFFIFFSCSLNLLLCVVVE